MPQTPHVFISYPRKDGQAFAADLVRRIEQAEIPVWRDRDGLRCETLRLVARHR